ncbi:triadin-like isoform X3 [Solea solea]|uniref:triadin-like isoform X3 n=1 Tax=Solea solea TaxID=90069 RepID=UPI00272B88AA|nr:triadin-like isoform X3 [Solea solea]
MSSQSNGGAAIPSARSSARSFMDDVILTFSSPMAWLLVVALILTWSGVAIVLFDLLDYKTLTDTDERQNIWAAKSLRSLPPPSAIAKRGLKGRGGVRPMKSSYAPITAPENTDWWEMMWTFAANLVAPEEEEEGIHHLTETLTSFHSEEL